MNSGLVKRGRGATTRFLLFPSCSISLGSKNEAPFYLNRQQRVNIIFGFLCKSVSAADAMGRRTTTNSTEICSGSRVGCLNPLFLWAKLCRCRAKVRRRHGYHYSDTRMRLRASVNAPRITDPGYNRSPITSPSAVALA